MAVYLVSYDLNSPGQLYDELITELRRIDSYRAQQSVWFVDVPQTAIQLRNALATYLDPNDTLWVQPVMAKAWAGYNLRGLAQWLSARRR